MKLFHGDESCSDIKLHEVMAYTKKYTLCIISQNQINPLANQTSKMRKKCSKGFLQRAGYCSEEMSVFKVWHKAWVIQTSIAVYCCSFFKYNENLVLDSSEILNGRCFSTVAWQMLVLYINVQLTSWTDVFCLEELTVGYCGLQICDHRFFHEDHSVL